jgi:NAD(P)H dehydrogenase (quinone)
MKIVISGASGDLGRRVTRLLLAQGRAADLTLVTRTAQRLAEVSPAEVKVVPGDFADRSSLDRAYAGGDVLFLISGLNIGRRVEEHRGAIEAATQAGIQHVVYTSVGGVNTGNPAMSARDHQQTERDLAASGLGYTILRNHLYAEIVSNIWIAPSLENGRLEMATGAGSLSPVAKDDVARSAAAVLSNPAAHNGSVYEITGPALLSMQDIVSIGSQVYDTPLTYVPVSEEERLAFFDSVGLPRTYDPSMKPSADGHLWASDELVTADLAVAQGYQAILSHHVSMLTGRTPEDLRSVMQRVKSLRYDQIAELV